MAARTGADSLMPSEPDFTRLFHQLNNQLGIILANAELLESRLSEPTERARAGHVVASALEAIRTAKAIRTKCQNID